LIALYPSKLPGQPLETYTLDRPQTILAWTLDTLPAYQVDTVPQHSVEVNGVEVPADQWVDYVIRHSDDVRLYIIPQGIGAGFVAWAVTAFVAAAALLYGMSISADVSASGASISGDSLEVSPAKANSVRLYEPIREVFGRARVYPDYLCQPVTRFIGPRDVRTSMFLAVASGVQSLSQLKIGGTPFSVFGDDVEFAIYGPGEFVGNDPRSENWYLAPEVGSSKSATAGLDLDSPVTTTSPSAEGLALNGNVVSLLGTAPEVPSNWQVGTIVNLEAPNTYQLSASGAYTLVAGDLAELQPFVGMEASVATPAADLDLIVAIVNPYIAPTPGTGGAASTVTASAAPTTYNFTTTPVTWNLTWQGVTRSISLIANYLNMSGLISEITTQLSGTGLVAQDNSGRVRVTEPSSPWRGGAIVMSSPPVSVWGASPVFFTGSASSGGSPGQTASIAFRFEDGTPVGGLGEGSQRMALGVRGFRYRITAIDGLSITLERLRDDGTVDTAWNGFSVRTLVDFLMTSDSGTGDNWLGPFFLCPEGEVVDRIEWDFFFPGGINHINKKGGLEAYGSRVITQYADVLTGDWVEIDRIYTGATRDAFGVTEEVNLAVPIRPMMRVRRAGYLNWANSQDNTQWLAVRGRLLERAVRYEGLTTLALTVRTGERLSAQSDRKINVVSTHLYPNGQPRKISSAVQYLMESIGAPPGAVDMLQLNDLETEYWTPRGETFDQQYTERTSVIKVLREILAAGMAHPTVEDSKVTAVREGVQPAQGIITPHDALTDLKIVFSAPSDDDFDGVDVKYTDPVTFEVLTVRCRFPGLAARRVEEFTVTQVQDKVRAWRIGMRRLQKHRSQRLAAESRTEMRALAYGYLDHVVFTSDIPGDDTLSAVIEGFQRYEDGEVVTLSERPDWSWSNPRAIICRQDGTATQPVQIERLNDCKVILPLGTIDWTIDWTIEPPRLVFFSTQKGPGYSMMLDSIKPNDASLCDVAGVEYSDELYRWDNSTPDANGYPQELTA
jgi:hypothetical protein